MTGNAVYVDGLPISGGTGGNTDASGKIAGLTQLRDEISGSRRIEGERNQIRRLLKCGEQRNRSGRGRTEFRNRREAGRNPGARERH